MHSDNPFIRRCSQVVLDKKWLISLLLILPAAIPYIVHYSYASEGLIPTGFLQNDMPQYLAYAREVFDGDRFSPVYGNPFDDDYDAPRVYFQSQTLIMALLWKITGWDMGAVFLVFGLLAALVCARVVIALYEHVVGLKSLAHWLGLVGFMWGGGALVAAGALRTLIAYGKVFDVLLLDPFDGWWFLNLGRNLIFPTEAYYHALFLGCITALLKKRHMLALGLAFLCSFSHHFTAVELLSTMVLWAVGERFFIQSDACPPGFLVRLSAICALFFIYIVMLSDSSPEHRQVVKQMSLSWTFLAPSMVAAYLYVGGLAMFQMRRLPLAREHLGQPQNRLFLAWFVVAFLLSNHEFMLRPVQPLHFTRGYIWMPLFLLGARPFVQLLSMPIKRWGSGLGGVMSAAIIMLFCMDNIYWLAQFPLDRRSGRTPIDVLMKPSERAVLDWMDRRQREDVLVLSLNTNISFLSTVYTPHRSWVSHHLTTPWYSDRKLSQRNYFATGKEDPSWRHRWLWAVEEKGKMTPKRAAFYSSQGARPVFQNKDFEVYEVPPRGQASGGK